MPPIFFLLFEVETLEGWNPDCEGRAEDHTSGEHMKKPKQTQLNPNWLQLQQVPLLFFFFLPSIRQTHVSTSFYWCFSMCRSWMTPRLQGPSKVQIKLPQNQYWVKKVDFSSGVGLFWYKRWNPWKQCIRVWLCFFFSYRET